MELLEDAAARMLAYRMKTRHELEMKLLTKGYDRQEISVVLDSFQNRGYLNDAEYAAVYYANGITKGKAIWRIDRELKERGVSSQDIQSGLEQYINQTQQDPKTDEYERGMAQAKKILAGSDPSDSKTMARAGRKLIALGYRGEMVYSILGELMRENNQ